jgi:hypothetical protein
VTSRCSGGDTAGAGRGRRAPADSHVLGLAAREFVETTTYLDEAAGEPYDPPTVPDVFDPSADCDSL